MNTFGQRFVLSLACFVLPQQTVAWQSPAILTDEQIREKIREHQDLIDSFRVVYRVQATAESGAPEGGYVFRVIEARNPSCLYHLSAHGHASLDWKDDPLTQIAYVTDHDLFNVFPFNRAFFHTSLTSDEQLPGSLGGELLFHATGVWLPRRFKPPQFQGYRQSLYEIGAASEYGLRSLQEPIGGRSCHVLDYDGLDVLWIDVEHGFCLVAREQRQRDSGALMRRFELGGHKAIANGIWFPTWIHNIQFDFLAPTQQQRSRKVVDSRVEILECTVNNAKEEFFDFKPPEGALELHGTTSGVTAAQHLPGGFDHLDDVASWIQRHGFSGGHAHGPARKNWPYGAMVSAVLIVLCEAYIWRAKRKFFATHTK